MPPRLTQPRSMVILARSATRSRPRSCGYARGDVGSGKIRPNWTPNQSLLSLSGGASTGCGSVCPLSSVLLAFGAIFQLYRASSRTLTEQTPIAQIDITALVGFAYVAPDQVLLANANGLLESRDGGRTWTENPLDVVPAALAAAPAGEGIAYVFAEDSVHVTADAGRTWQTITGTLPGADVLAAAVNPYVPTEIYASFADAGLQRSRDGGRSWEPVGTPDDDAVVAILVGGVPPLLYIAVECGKSPGEQRRGRYLARGERSRNDGTTGTRPRPRRRGGRLVCSTRRPIPVSTCRRQPGRPG